MIIYVEAISKKENDEILIASKFKYTHTFTHTSAIHQLPPRKMNI